MFFCRFLTQLKFALVQRGAQLGVKLGQSQRATKNRVRCILSSIASDFKIEFQCELLLVWSSGHMISAAKFDFLGNRFTLKAPRMWIFPQASKVFLTSSGYFSDFQKRKSEICALSRLLNELCSFTKQFYLGQKQLSICDLGKLIENSCPPFRIEMPNHSFSRCTKPTQRIMYSWWMGGLGYFCPWLNGYF